MARRRLPIWFRQAEADGLVAAADTERNRLIILLGLYCGLRVSELTKLEVADLDLAEYVLMVRAGKGDKDRNIPIPSRLIGPLRAWIGSKTAGLVFSSPRGGGQLSSRCLQRMLKRVAALAGLPNANVSRKVTPHKLRHTYATTLHQRGASIREIQELLGHSSVATTEIYTHVDPSRLKGVVDRLHFGTEEAPNGQATQEPPGPGQEPGSRPDERPVSGTNPVDGDSGGTAGGGCEPD